MTKSGLAIQGLKAEAVIPQERKHLSDGHATPGLEEVVEAGRLAGADRVQQHIRMVGRLGMSDK